MNSNPSTEEVEAAPPEEPQDDRQLVPESSWWKSKDGTRTFVVLKVLSLDGTLKRAWLLEQPHDTPFTLEGPDFKDYIRSGHMVRVRHVIPTPPDAWKNVKR